MYNLTELSDDEIKYICEHMDLKYVRDYFKQNPKGFNKINPGYTVKETLNKSIHCKCKLV